jgi:hypothetical protein
VGPLIRADSPDSFLDETPPAVLIRQVLGAVSQSEKAALVAKLRAARDRKKAATGKCGGRPSVVESSPEAVALAKGCIAIRSTGTGGRCATWRPS